MVAALRAHVAWLVHALGFSPNPLRRRVDRIAAAVTVLLLITALAAVPAGMVVGSGLHTDLSAKAEHDAATSRQVEGTLLTPPEVHVPAAEAYAHAQLDASARVQWSTEAGSRSATLQVPDTAEPGDTIRLWADERGDRVPAPASSGDVVLSAVLGGVFVLLLTQLTCAGLIVATQYLARLQGQRAWARQWSFLQRGGSWSQL